MDIGAWRAIVHGVAKNQTQLSDYHFHFGDVRQPLCSDIQNSSIESEPTPPVPRYMTLSSILLKKNTEK